jgi:ribonucleotide reductase alpha subunit
VEEEIHRPATLGHDVVHRDQEEVVALARTQEQRAKERAVLEIEWCGRRYRREASGGRLPVRCRHVAQVAQLAANVQRWCDDLLWYTVNEIEGGAQDIVAPDDLVDRAHEQLRIEVATEPQCAGHVVYRGVRFQLVEEPDPFLCER